MQNLYKKKIASLISFFTLKKKLGDRILTYHSINNKKNSTTSNIYQLEKDLFYNQVKLLIDKKVNFELIDNFQNNKTNYLLTFDDGFKNLKDKILEFLSNHKIPCLLFLCPDLIKSNNKNYLNLSDVKEISKNEFIKIGSHAYTHQKLTDHNDLNLNFQLESSKKWLEDITSKKVNAISYPFGAFNKKVLEKVKLFGYKYGFTTKFNFYDSSHESKLQIPRVDIWDSDDLNTFTNKINGKWNWMRFFSKY